jgi:type I restriction enzyme S subunit
LPEQRKIVAQIENISQKLNEAYKLQEVTRKEINTLWKSLCAEMFKKVENYGTKPLSEVAVLERGKFSYRPRNSPIFFGGDHPWIQIGEIESANKHITHWTETLNDEGLAISKKFPKGTLLVSIAATIGAVGILDFDCCVPDSIVGVTPRKGTHGEYLYYFFTYLRSHLEKIAPESARKNINLEILSAIKIPAPPVEEQIRVAEYLNQIRTRIDEVENIGSGVATKLEAISPSIMSKMFKGDS